MGGGKTRALTLALLGALLLAAAPSQAVVLKGRGELTAAGSGLAVLDVRGVVKVRGVGLLIVERNAEVEVEGHGQVTPLLDGRVLYEGFGRARIRSLARPTRVEAAGARIRLHAHGAGIARLLGHGVFYTSDLDGRWGADLEVEFDSEAP